MTDELKKLLMVDDDIFRYAGKMKIFLQKKGIEMQMAEDFDGALELIRNNKFDLMLLDVGLAGQKNGLDLLKEIRKNDKDTAVYILTAYLDHEKEAMASGATRFILKPFDYNEHVLKPLGLMK
jgi:DNA-binding response OmpR family regulator